ncbi:hypothetical protein O3G_MSEX013332 [Manduca sexta]|uniref:Uncharacterized protein n=1 Tax=Manduca sexta TaxID=7130 RepID=A0A922CWX3_MANSE|nr:hypothetical protein O3G_MSEX013332 [Manduca sexta]
MVCTITHLLLFTGVCFKSVYSECDARCSGNSCNAGLSETAQCFSKCSDPSCSAGCIGSNCTAHCDGAGCHATVSFFYPTEQNNTIALVFRTAHE